RRPADRRRPFRVTRRRRPVRPPRRSPGLRRPVRSGGAGAGDRRRAPAGGGLPVPGTGPDRSRDQKARLLRPAGGRPARAADHPGAAGGRPAGRPPPAHRLGTRMEMERPDPAGHPLSARDRLPARLHRGRREGIPPGRREGTPYGRREDTPCGRRQGVQRGRREGVPRARRCPAMKAADQSMIDAREAGPEAPADRAGSAAAAGGVSAAVAAPVRGPDAGPGGGGPGGFGWWRVFRVVRGPVAVQLAVLAGFVAAGIAVSWPRVTYLAGRLPATRDAGSYVWGVWWVARQGEHLGNPG